MGYLSSIFLRIRSALAGQDGIALLMVLVVITILTTLVVSFTETTQKHLQVTQYSKNRLQAYWAAQSGLQAATALLRMNAQVSAAFRARKHDGATSPWNCESDEYQEFVPLLLANVFCESSMLEPALLLNDPTESVTGMTLSRCPSAVPILDENRKLSLSKLISNIGTNKEKTDDGHLRSCPVPAPVPAQGGGLRHGRGGSGNRDRLRPREETKINITRQGISPATWSTGSTRRIQRPRPSTTRTRRNRAARKTDCPTRRRTACSIRSTRSAWSAASGNCPARPSSG